MWSSEHWLDEKGQHNGCMITRFTPTLLLIAFTALPSVLHGNNAADSGNSGHESASGAVVELVLLERSSKQLKFQVKTKNTGQRAVLIVSDPVRVDGDRLAGAVQGH